MLRIDIHCHLLPDFDDGCPTLPDSLDAARQFVAAGYSHVFCTPHVWPNLPRSNVVDIPAATAALQRELDARDIRLTLLPGGEYNLRPETVQIPPQEFVTYALNRRFFLFDIWADVLPDFFAPSIRYLQSLGLKVILAHPERMRAVQDDPPLVEKLLEMDLLLQGNLQCLADPPDHINRITMERMLLEDRYFAVATDNHRAEHLPSRIAALARLRELAGVDKLDELTIHNPARLLPRSAFD